MRPKTLILWCPSGISGDMLVGAMIDLGLDPISVSNSIATLGLGHEIYITTSKVRQRDFVATAFHVSSDRSSPKRTYESIVELIENSSLKDAIKQTMLKLLWVLGTAESKVHGVELEDVHFHEVGSWDTITDLLAIALGLDQLNIEKVVLKCLEVGSGSMSTSSHGVVSIPAPATLELLTGFDFTSTVIGCELCTPTGAAFISAFAEKQDGPLNQTTLLKTGYGAGTMKLSDRANVLIAGLVQESEVGKNGAYFYDRVIKLETNVDDRSPEYVALVVSLLLEKGALDAWTTGVTGKKGRAGVVISVLCEEMDSEPLTEVLHRNLGTLGVRISTVMRHLLDRDLLELVVDGHVVRVKVNPYSSKVEFDDLARLAREEDLSIIDAHERCAIEFRKIYPESPSPS